jgi:hypothetical protein
MGNPALYYYPSTALSAGTVGLLEKVDFGEPISDIQITPIRQVSDTVSFSGRASRTSWQSGISVRIVLERFTDDALARDLYSFSSHAERGKHFAFALDSDKAVAIVPRSTGWSRGSTVLSGSGNIFRKWEPSATLAVNDIVHISGPAPKNNREEHKLDAWTMTTGISSFTLADGIRYDHSYPAALRHRDFFPVLYLPEAEVSRPMLTHDHRISYTWECQGVLFPWWASSLAEEPDKLAGTTVGLDDGTDLDAIMESGSTVPITPDSRDIETSYERIEPRVTDMYTPTWWRG